MKQNVWKGLVLLLLGAAFLSACGSGTTQEITGLVTELHTGDNGDLTAIVIQTDEGKETGILLTEETRAYLPALGPDMMISADCADGKKVFTTDNGAQINAYESHHIDVTGQLNRGAATTRGGTQIDVVESYAWSHRIYRLADGTELLRVNRSSGPDHVLVAGVEGFDSLGERAQEQVRAYYERRGLLYDEQEELEKVYALYQELGMDFRSGLVEQSVSPAASSDRVMYFLTTVTLPTGHGNGNILCETRLCDAFDRETGAHIDTWDLFAAPKEAVMKAMLDESGITDQDLRAEMEAVSWDGHIVFFPDGLSVEFDLAALSGEPNHNAFFFGYTPAIRELMQDWAVPKIQN